jgi:DNA-binding Lrp family transcriptional regulator
MSQDNLPVKKELSDQQILIAYWAAHRFEPKEIAKELRLAESTVKKFLKDPDVKFQIRKVQMKIYGEDPALHIKECAARGIEVADEIMMNKKVKPHIRQEVAFKFMDRAYGKPGIEDTMVEGTVRKILQVVTNIQNGVDLKVEAPKDDIEDAEFKELPQEPAKEELKEADKVDDWIDKNIK